LQHATSMNMKDGERIIRLVQDFFLNIWWFRSAPACIHAMRSLVDLPIAPASVAPARPDIATDNATGVILDTVGAVMSGVTSAVLNGVSGAPAKRPRRVTELELLDEGFQLLFVNPLGVPIVRDWNTFFGEFRLPKHLLTRCISNSKYFVSNYILVSFFISGGLSLMSMKPFGLIVALQYIVLTAIFNLLGTSFDAPTGLRVVFWMHSVLWLMFCFNMLVLSMAVRCLIVALILAHAVFKTRKLTQLVGSNVHMKKIA